MERFSVVIATRNRSRLVGRAISSAAAEGIAKPDIIVVDDASEDGTEKVVRAEFPEVTYVRLNHCSGPGPARMAGLRAARSRYALILDDDDNLIRGACSKIAAHIGEDTCLAQKPVLFFSGSGATMPGDFILLRPTHLLNGMLRGDFVPVINVAAFLEASYEYPKIRVGGEGLLWLQIAEDAGIPAWSTTVTQVNGDAPNRLTSVKNQINRAREYAELQDLYLTQHSDLLRRWAPEELRIRRLGSAVYWLLAGDRKSARQRGRSGELGALHSITIIALSIAPIPFVRIAFSAYRRTTARAH